ncbi:glucosamine-6-phosphate deaminase [Salegentibacter flavus]|uniref:Glucosamine-6-phosphate deaminase n=1 Tax=Salegentibacter flavus TaxID=287099 RepID=A0A1I5CT38_9FLAO|nr:glucosamine-6-phosphate deaminase [Salegentibacter flavus]SFN90140.1 glucosamine-6-phosphate deaminase [Salegentibacter flavus]
MTINISENPAELGKLAGSSAADFIRASIDKRGACNIILATGTSQFETLNQLLEEPDINWSKVVVFHLDEYIDLPITHPASFRKYLKERFVEKVDTLQSVFFIDGEVDPKDECKRLGEAIHKHPIDVALIGIGENGHLAFNDPPADFETDDPFIVVELDEECRKQQFNEGWFPNIEAVPRKAISMSIKQILKSRHIFCSVPDRRKAKAVKDCLEKEVSNFHPASILQQHPNCRIFLDTASAALLTIK